MDNIIIEGSNVLKTIDIDLKYPELDILIDLLHVYQYKPNETFTFHSHPNFELHYYADGEGEIAFIDTKLTPTEFFTIPAAVKSKSDPTLVEFQIEKEDNLNIIHKSQVFKVKKGSTFFNPPGQFLWQRSSKDKPLVEYAMRFSFKTKKSDNPINPHFVKEYKLIHQLLSQHIIKVEENFEIKTIFETIFKEAYYKKPAFLVKIKNELVNLIIAYSRFAWDKKQFNYFIPEIDLNSRRLSLIEKYILSNISVNITIEQLAKNVNMSERTLSRFIKEKKGVSIHQYITQIKVNKAVSLIKLNEHTLSDIAFIAGFSSPFHLSKIVKKHTGKSPSEFNVTVHRKTDPLVES